MKKPVISNVNIYGIDESLKASKYPKATDLARLTSAITPTIRNLAASNPGEGHDVFLQGIVVQFDLTFTIKAWTEAQRYHFLDFVSSQSTMHRILKFDIDSQCNEYVDSRIKAALNEIISEYDKGDPESYLKVLYNVPTGFRLTARMTTNYRQLKTIYRQRRTHRLPEWREFCLWIESLPYSSFITGKGSEEA